MNTNTLRRNYKSLTIEERFAAMESALARKDDIDRRTLLNSAPRLRFSFPDTYGLSQVFTHATLVHVLAQLNYVATLNFLLSQDEESVIEGHTVDDLIHLTMRRILTEHDAWEAISLELGVDPEQSLKNTPGIEMVALTELIVMAVNKQRPMELSDIQATIDRYRKVIKAFRNEWEYS